MTSPLAKILLRPLITSVLFGVLYGVYLTLSRQPQIFLTLFVVMGFYFAASLLLERFVFPKIGL